jgi:hypothetical protein
VRGAGLCRPSSVAGSVTTNWLQRGATEGLSLTIPVDPHWAAVTMPLSTLKRRMGPLRLGSSPRLVTFLDFPNQLEVVEGRMSTFVTNAREGAIVRGLSVFFAPRRVRVRNRRP